MSAPRISKSAIEQTIDLGEVFGADLTDAAGLKEAIAQAIIDKIIARTESGKGMKFSSSGAGREVELHSPYSDAYVKSLEFKAAGKKRNDINMTLTGDMLASLDVLSTVGNKIKIGVVDDLQVLKAFNHITGDTVPERPWFGISKSELKEIAVQFQQDLQSLRVQQPLTSMEQRALALMDQIRSSDGGAVSVDDSFDDEGD